MSDIRTSMALQIAALLREEGEGIQQATMIDGEPATVGVETTSGNEFFVTVEFA